MLRDLIFMVCRFAIVFVLSLPAKFLFESLLLESAGLESLDSEIKAVAALLIGLAVFTEFIIAGSVILACCFKTVFLGLLGEPSGRS